MSAKPDLANPAARVQPNIPQAESLEVVQQGRYNPLTQSVSSYPEVLVASNDGYVGVTNITRFS